MTWIHVLFFVHLKTRLIILVNVSNLWHTGCPTKKFTFFKPVFLRPLISLRKRFDRSEINFVMSNFLCRERGGGWSKSERPNFLCPYLPGGEGIGGLYNVQSIVVFLVAPLRQNINRVCILRVLGAIKINNKITGARGCDFLSSLEQFWMIRTRPRQDWVKLKQTRRDRDKTVWKFFIRDETETRQPPKFCMRPGRDRESRYF